jgi:type II secretory pathway component PulF
VAVVVGVLTAALLQFKRTEPGIKVFANLKLNVPIFSGMMRTLYMARFSRTASILLSTGVSVLDTMHISGESMNNVVVQESIEKAATEVQAGKGLSVALKDKDYILDLVPQMAAIGEQSGKMDEMLAKAAQVYEDELDEKVATISTLIEPIMMVAMAIIAGLLVGGVLFPIYSLVNSIG